MNRYVLFRRGSEPDLTEIQAIGQSPGVHIVDRELRRAMLVEADKNSIEDLRRRFPEWTIAPDVTYPLPDTK